VRVIGRLTAGEVEAARSGLARFVGIEAYEAAGGVVRRDLFDSEHSRFLADPSLLQRLALEKLETTVAVLNGEGWRWVEARLDLDSKALRQFVPAEYDVRKPTADELQELAELTQRSRELEQQSDALCDRQEGLTDEAEAIDLEEQDIAARQRAIQQGLRVWAPDVKSVAGAMITINREGDVEVIRGLVRETDRRMLNAALRRNQKSKGSVEENPHDGAAATCSRAWRPGRT
jgi:ParB family transcriptional regulator, chromosome partitioning protein